MTEKKKANCFHNSFRCEEVAVEGIGIVVSVIRCKDCGEAISTFFPDEIITLSRINAKLDKLHKDIKKLPG
ncbi:MAG: hypothetical protein LBH43_15675 [Treponema sp.]|nr:hypothetical protein [Treponema sp.]